MKSIMSGVRLGNVTACSSLLQTTSLCLLALCSEISDKSVYLTRILKQNIVDIDVKLLLLEIMFQITFSFAVTIVFNKQS